MSACKLMATYPIVVKIFQLDLSGVSTELLRAVLSFLLSLFSDEMLKNLLPGYSEPKIRYAVGI